jgi:hypothetical protein
MSSGRVIALRLRECPVQCNDVEKLLGFVHSRIRVAQTS